MEKEQIIKALECWASRSPCHEKCSILEHEEGANCIGLTTKSALALIKELTEENERLKEKADRHLDNLKAVLEERSENTIVADTVKRFAERLKAICWGEIIVPNTIDRIAKEILEGEME